MKLDKPLNRLPTLARRTALVLTEDGCVIREVAPDSPLKGLVDFIAMKDGQILIVAAVAGPMNAVDKITKLLNSDAAYRSVCELGAIGQVHIWHNPEHGRCSVRVAVLTPEDFQQ